MHATTTTQVDARAAPVRLPTAALRANDYNPNQMTKAAFAALVAEVRHLGRLPKPVVVRPDGDGYVIVDGEHGWRAAQEVGLSEVSCEVIAADDFEAMRQTYKRNQHGTHDPVRLGRVFRRVREARGLSQRALASEIAVSEGTIRNAVLYAEAADLRNRYAPRAVRRAPTGEPTTADEEMAALSRRQVRTYVELPAAVRDTWLEAGADLKALAERPCRAPTALSADGERLIRVAVQRLAQSDAMRETTIGERPTPQVLEERLRALPWPELVLLAALVLGDGEDPGPAWKQALGYELSQERAKIKVR